MSKDQHEFQFPADRIALAAWDEADYHEGRVAYWKAEYETSFARVKETARIVVKEVNITGGKRADVTVDYGDAAAFRRLNESITKIESHRKAADRFRTEATVYGTQGERAYELSTEDVHYFRLGGGEREE